jgi:hypothetical protein
VRIHRQLIDRLNLSDLDRREREVVATIRKVVRTSSRRSIYRSTWRAGAAAVASR